MNEFIISSEQLERLIEAIEHNTGREINRMVIDGKRATEIVRCRDCIHYKPYRTYHHGMMNRCYDEHGHTHKRDESDFCSWGEPKEGGE